MSGFSTGPTRPDRVIFSRDPDTPAHIRGGEEIQNRLAAPPIGEVPDFKPVLPPPGLLAHLRPQNLLLGLPVGAVLEDVLPRLRPVWAPPALGGWTGSPSTTGTGQ
jgi:hypothetical protein